MKRAAPPIWPYLDHRSMAQVKTWQGVPQRVMKGWWPSTIAGYDIAGRKL